MKNMALAIVAAVVLVGCTKPQDIVLGPEPLKQLSEQGDKFKQLSEQDRTLLATYLMAHEMAQTVAKSFNSAPSMPIVTGKTVGEVLGDARKWKGEQLASEAQAKATRAEADALKAKVMAERKALSDKIGSSVVVAVTGKRVLPKNYDAGRYSAMLMISYAVENKTDKVIRQLKGHVRFIDPTGDAIGSLSEVFDEQVQPGKTLKTDTGRGWKLNEFINNDIQKIADHDFSAMTAIFEPESIAFNDGEVLKLPDL